MRVFDVSQYEENRSLTSSGVLYYPTVKGDEFFPDGYNQNHDSPVFQDEAMATLEKYMNDQYVFLNIECWRVRTSEERAQSVPKYVEIMQMAQSLCNGQVGIYIDRTNWWNLPMKDQGYNNSTTFADENLAEVELKPIDDLCDFIVRQAYFEDFAKEDTSEHYAIARSLFCQRMRYLSRANYINERPEKPVAWYVMWQEITKLSGDDRYRSRPAAEFEADLAAIMDVSASQDMFCSWTTNRGELPKAYPQDIENALIRLSRM